MANPAIDQIFVVVFPESAPPTVLQRNFYYQFQNSDVQPSLPLQPETNTNFIGKFSYPQYTVLQRNLYQQYQNSDIPPFVPQLETNTSFIGKFFYPPYTVKRYPGLAEEPVPASPLQPEGGLSVIAFPENEVPTQSQRALFYQFQGHDGLVAAPQPETNPHFTGHFLAPPYTVSSSQRGFLYQFPSGDGPTGVLQPETNTHFTGHFVASPYKGSSSQWGLFYQFQSRDGPVGVLQPETNTHFSGRFKAAPYRVTLYPGTPQEQALASPLQPEGGLSVIAFPEAEVPTSAQRDLFYQFQSTDGQPPIGQPETNTHFIGRYAAPPYKVHLYGSVTGDVVLPTLPVGEHLFVIAYPENDFPSELQRLLYLQNLSNDVSVAPPVASPLQPESGLFVIAFPEAEVPTQSQRNLFYQSQSQELPPPVSFVETNQNFIARYKADPYRVSLYGGLSNDAVNLAGSETHIQVIAFPQESLPTAAQRAFYLEGTGNDIQPLPPQYETNPPFIARYRADPYRVTLYPSLNEDVHIDAQPETNTNSIGKFRADSYRVTLYRGLNEDVYLPPQPETNTHFINKFRSDPYRVTLYQGPSQEPIIISPFQPDSGLFVIAFPEAETPTQLQRSLFYQRQSLEGPAPIPQPETNVSFIGRYQRSHLARRFGDVANVPLDIIIPDNPINFTNRYAAAKFLATSRLYCGFDWLTIPPSFSGYVVPSDSALAYVIAFDGMPGPQSWQIPMPS